MMADRSPTVFIGSSKESLEVARAIEYHLKDVATVTAWPEVPVSPGLTILEWLVRQIDAFDFAVMILAPDDVSESRGEKFPVVRDNVIFELGLFMGRLGRERTFIVQEGDTQLELPRDLGSVIPAFYEKRADGNWKASLSVAAATIKDGIRSLSSVAHLETSTSSAYRTKSLVCG
jgi:predicted nucleotide-binding protein